MTIWKVGFGSVALVALGGCLQGVEPVDQLMEGLGGNGCDGMGIAGTGGSNGCTCYQVVQDTTIDSSASTTNFGSGTTCAVDGSPEMSCLLKWNLSLIPTTATITAGMVTVNVVDASLASYQGQRLLRAWGETGATWQKATSSVSWAAPGAQAGTDRASGALFTFSGHVGTQSALLTSTFGIPAVQSWVTSPSNNQGVVISSPDTHRMAIAAKESGLSSARLCLEYRVP